MRIRRKRKEREEREIDRESILVISFYLFLLNGLPQF